MSDARHASDTARPILIGVRQCPTRVGRARQRRIQRVSGVRHCSGPHRVELPYWATVEMAAPTWARAKARARARVGPHPACVRANVHVGAALSRNP